MDGKDTKIRNAKATICSKQLLQTEYKTKFAFSNRKGILWPYKTWGKPARLIYNMCPGLKQQYSLSTKAYINYFGHVVIFIRFVYNKWYNPGASSARELSLFRVN